MNPRVISALGLALTSFGCCHLFGTCLPTPPPVPPPPPAAISCTQTTSGPPAFNCTPPPSGTPAYVSAARFPGTSIQISGVQLCDAATKVNVGCDTTPNVVDSCGPNGVQATTHVSRLSTDGSVRLLAGKTLPASPLASSQPFTVRTMRNQNGFNFENEGNIPQEDLSDYKELFGADQFTIQIDPCSLVGAHCPIPTGVPDPTAYVYALVTMAMANGNGECFGFVMGSQRLMLGEVPIASFDPAASTVWTMTSAAPGLQHFLTVQHLGQFSAEWLLAYALRSASNGVDSAAFQHTRDRINAALSASPPDFPLMSIRSGGEGHVLVAYDLESGTASNGGKGNGDYFIYVYDPNQPFLTEENGNFPLHQTLEQAQGRIHVMNDNTWTFTGNFAGGMNDWSGGMDSLVPLPHSTVPLQHPTLPSLSALGSLVFASGGVDTVQITDGGGKHLLKSRWTVDHTPGSSIPDAAIMPSLAASGGAKNSPLFAFAHPGSYRQEVRANAAGGAYQAGAITKSFTTVVASASLAGQATNDQLTFDGPDHALTFASGGGKTVAIQLAARADDGSNTHVVLLQADASNGSADKVSFGTGGSVRLDHPSGGQAGFRFTLGTVQRMGGVTAFVSPILTIVPGDSVVLTPADWSRLDTKAVDVVTTHAGKASEQTLMPPPPVTVTGPTAAGLLTLTVSAAPLGLQPLAVAEASCTGDASNWIKIAKFDGTGPRTVLGTFSLTFKGCSNAPGATNTVLVRAVDAQGAVSMIAPLTVRVPRAVPVPPAVPVPAIR